MAVDLLGAIKLVISPVTKLGSWTYRKARLWAFRIRNRKPPLGEGAAKNIAFAVLAGSIDRAIPYRNIDSKNLFMAVARRSSEEEHDDRIYVLEKTGNTFRKIWTSEEVFGFDGESLEVADIDGDGINEVVFAETSFGTGAGSKTFFVYSTAKKRQYGVVELYNWQDSTSPILPELEIRGDDDKAFLDTVIDFASKRGFLQASDTIDLDNPKYAVQRWHKENGKKENGIIHVHYFDGLPQCTASVATELDTNRIRWTGYFKGPLYGYIKGDDKHFIAYSPAWAYNWAKTLACDGERLWFGIHIGEGLFSFDIQSKELSHYLVYRDNELPEIEEVLFNEVDASIILNREMEIPLRDIDFLSTRKKKDSDAIRRTGLLQ